jgi:hypothetical protein
MIVKLNKNQFECLEQSLSEERNIIKLNLQIKKNNRFIIIELDDEVADEIRDWVIEELQKKGFDENYKLTALGKNLEELIDKFYIK